MSGRGVAELCSGGAFGVVVSLRFCFLELEVDTSGFDIASSFHRTLEEQIQSEMEQMNDCTDEGCKQ